MTKTKKRGRPRKQPDTAPPKEALRSAMQDVRSQRARAALTKHGAVPAAAKALGVTAQTLRNWVRADPSIAEGLTIKERGEHRAKPWKLYRLRDGSGLVANARASSPKLYRFDQARGAWAEKIAWEGHAGRELEAVPESDVAEVAGNTGWPGATSK